MRGVLGFVPAVLGTVMVALFGAWFGVTVGELTRLPEPVVECGEEVVYPGYSYTRTVCRYEEEDGEVVETSPEGAEAARSAKRDPLTTKAVGLGLITGVSLVAPRHHHRGARTLSVYTCIA